MYLPLILFFISLLGIGALLYRRVMILENSGVLVREIDGEFFFDVPDLHEVQYVMIRQMKKYGYIALVVTIRFYIRSSKIMDYLYMEAKSKLKELYRKYAPKRKQEGEAKDVSKFLKVVSEYKYKIGQIKERIREEEGLK